MPSNGLKLRFCHMGNRNMTFVALAYGLHRLCIGYIDHDGPEATSVEHLSYINDDAARSHCKGVESLAADFDKSTPDVSNALGDRIWWWSQFPPNF